MVKTLPCPELLTNVTCKQMDGHHLAGTLIDLTLIANTEAKNSYGALALSFVFPLQEIKALVGKHLRTGFCFGSGCHYILILLGNLAVTVS